MNWRILCVVAIGFYIGHAKAAEEDRSWISDGYNIGHWGTRDEFQSLTVRNVDVGNVVTVTVQGVVTISYCEAGWTLVSVKSIHGTNVPKCAAVGDLQDPKMK